MTGKPAIVKRAEWARDETLWKGVIEGRQLGSALTILFYTTDETGVGPRWHVHPYDEIFIIREGRALFTVGDEKIEAEAGDIVFGPANVPHKYHNLGPGRLTSTDIHLSPEWIQTDLEDPELS
ncbi:MAG: cupin domain-containing protein [Methyloligellaceae bacterium]|nr:MAG: cupin domain-containing protein [Alphaproteobacteria bacterium]